MIDKEVLIRVNGKDIRCSSSTTYDELSKKFKSDFKFPIIAVKENNQFVDIRSRVMPGANIEFFDYSNREANNIYINGLVFLTIYSIVQLFSKKAMITVEHSIDKGLYLSVNFKLDQEKLNMIKKKMLEVVEADYPIKRTYVKRTAAIDYFVKEKLYPKAGLLRYNTNTYVTLYKLDDMYDFYFSQMPASTKVLSRFELTLLNDHGFILSFPTSFEPGVIKEYEHYPKLFNLFNEFYELSDILNVYNVNDYNDLVVNNRMDDLIRIEETLLNNRTLEIARAIHKQRDKIRIILLAGPSCSGKTTTSIKLSHYLRSFGTKTKKISMDDYFVNREDTPLDEDGRPDYDDLKAIKLDLFDEQIDALVNRGEKVVTPIFDFKKGEGLLINEIELAEDEILIIEGIHAINPSILKSIDDDKKLKLYVCPATNLNIDNHNRVSTTDNRLLRRMVRDSRTRGYSPSTTLEVWPIVRRGEERHIFPYQGEADLMLNTATIYEIGVLALYALPLLYSVGMDSPYYEEAKRLINLLKNFLPVPSDEIPRDSILREFVGGSCYKVH